MIFNSEYTKAQKQNRNIIHPFGSCQEWSLEVSKAYCGNNAEARKQVNEFVRAFGCIAASEKLYKEDNRPSDGEDPDSDT